MDSAADRLHRAGHTAASLLGWQLPGWPAFSSPGCNTATFVQVQSPFDCMALLSVMNIHALEVTLLSAINTHSLEVGFV